MTVADSGLVPQNDDEILEAFADLLGELVPEKLEDIEVLLTEAGLDPRQIDIEAAALIKEARSKTPLDWRNKQQEIEKVTAQHERSGANLPRDFQSLLDIWRQLMSQPQAERVFAEVRYRNQSPEDLSVEELRSLIQDIRFVLSEIAEDRDVGKKE